MATHSFKKMVHGLYDALREVVPSSNVIAHHGRMIGIGLVVAGGLGCSYLGYRWYVSHREQSAQELFATYQQDYALASQDTASQDWQRVAALFEHGYTTHTASNLAPYFLLLASDAHLKQGDRAAALQTLEKAISAAGSSGLVSLMNMKRSLMMLDDADEALQQQGLDLLMSVARDTSNQFRDAALFYLGRYYWEINKQDEAQKAWQELVDSQEIEKGSQSPWVHDAKQRLKQLVNRSGLV